MPRESVASRKRPPTVLQDEQIKPLIGACSNRAPTGIRNRTVGGAVALRVAHSGSAKRFGALVKRLFDRVELVRGEPMSEQPADRHWRPLQLRRRRSTRARR
jgi:hypothetical protein